MQCPNCGKENKFTEIYCSSCGASFVTGGGGETGGNEASVKAAIDASIPQWTQARLIEAHSTPFKMGSIKWNLIFQFARCLAFSGNGKKLYSGSLNKELKAWDPDTGELLNSVKADDWSIEGIASSPDGSQLLTVGWDLESKLWDPESLSVIRKFTGSIEYKYSVAFSPCGYYAAIGSVNKVEIFDIASGKCEKMVEPGIQKVNSLSYSPDGKTLAIGESGKNLLIMDVAQGAIIKTLSEHGKGVRGTAFTRDGKYLISGGNDNNARIWETASYKCVKTLIGHQSEITSVNIPPVGNYCITTSHDETVKVWSLTSFECADSMEGHKTWVESSVFSPDGKYLATGDGIGNIIIWERL